MKERKREMAIKYSDQYSFKAVSYDQKHCLCDNFYTCGDKIRELKHLCNMYP